MIKPDLILLNFININFLISDIQNQTDLYLYVYVYINQRLG